MGLRILLALCGLVLVGLGYMVFAQQQQLERLERDITGLRAELEEHDDTSEPSYAAAPTARDQPVRVPADPTAAAHPPEPPPTPAVRVAVTEGDVARVETAVLRLLEEDHPELRAKLRSVVQEQQQTLEQEQREQRRERWITRREAVLAELGKEIGLSTEQRQEIMGIVLATRDQIADLRQSAETTPEAFAVTRDKMLALREQAAAQVKALLKPEQYEAYRARFDDDDDDRRWQQRPDRPERSPRP